MGKREIDIPTGKKAVFLDRDGVITANVFYEAWGEWEAPMSPGDAVLLPMVTEALLRLQDAGFLLFIVSNQAAFAKGKTSLESLTGTAAHVNEILRRAGVVITESYYSFTHPRGVVKHFSGASLERKPGPYFLYLAAAVYKLDLSNSWMIGDRSADVLCGKAAGCKTFQILDIDDINDTMTDDSAVPDERANTLHDAVSIILSYH